ncbi:MAG: zinc ribbon domain-containing protein [Planctomycetia bacterium]
MSAASVSLRELHEVLVELADLRTQSKRGPMVLKVKQGEVEKAEASLAATRDAHRKLRMDADQRELTLKIGEQKVKDLKGKQLESKNNKEYQALTEEIARFQTANNTLQEEILGFLDVVESKAEEVKSAEAVLGALKGKFAEFKEKHDYTMQKVAGQIEIMEKRRLECEKNLDPQFMGEYARVAKARGEKSMSGCKDKTCQACFAEQTDQKWIDVCNSRLVFCRNCGAILYMLT